MELKDQIEPEEIEELLKQRKKGKADFILVDVREEDEYEASHIIGTDYLVPTSSFEKDVRKLKEFKDKNIILYCRASRRSLIYQNIMKEMGYKHVSNMLIGIIGYNGEKS